MPLYRVLTLHQFVAAFHTACQPHCLKHFGLQLNAVRSLVVLADDSIVQNHSDLVCSLDTFRKPVVHINKCANIRQKTNRSGAETNIGCGFVFID